MRRKLILLTGGTIFLLIVTILFISLSLGKINENKIDSAVIKELGQNSKVKVIIHDGSFDEFKAFKKTTKYKKLIGHINIQLIFKHKANEKIVIDKFLNNIINDDTISKDFKTILNRIIVDTNDDNLTKCYEKVFK